MTRDVAYLVFDIETVTDGQLLREVEFPGEDITPQVAISRYRQQLEAEGKNDFVPHTYARPVSVAICKVDEYYSLIEVVTLDRPAFNPKKITEQFWAGWAAYRRPTFVTFAGRIFDIPVMELNAFHFGIPVDGWFDDNGPNYTHPRYRYNTASHLDLMDAMSAYGATRMPGGLNLLAKSIGLPGKMDVNGAMVQDMYDAGKHVEIDNYCICDALDTYFIFLRWKLITGGVSQHRCRELVQRAVDTLAQQAGAYPVITTYLGTLDMSKW